MRTTRTSIPLGLVLLLASGAQGADLSGPLKQLQAVGPYGQGHEAATAAWAEVVRAEAGQLPTVLAALDGANPLAANWIRTAVDTIAERALARGVRLPAAQLEAFLHQRSHAPQGRRLAYEWLVRVDPTAAARLIPRMLDDPSLELRRDAVARLMAEGEEQVKADQKPQALATLGRAMAAARDVDQIRTLAQRLGQLGHPVDIAQHMGFLRNWHVIGPFDNTDEKGYDTVYPPEREIRFNASYPGKHKPVQWFAHTTNDEWGLVDFNKLLGEEKLVVAYATCEYYAPKAQRVQFRLTSLDATRLWLNGRLIDEHRVYHGGSALDQYVCQADLQPGRNVILLKVCQNAIMQEWARKWEFQLRVCDEQGTAIPSAKPTGNP
jgi:hypothetical protein